MADRLAREHQASGGRPWPPEARDSSQAEGERRGSAGVRDGTGSGRRTTWVAETPRGSVGKSRLPPGDGREVVTREPLWRPVLEGCCKHRSVGPSSDVEGAGKDPGDGAGGEAGEGRLAESARTTSAGRQAGRPIDRGRPHPLEPERRTARSPGRRLAHWVETPGGYGSSASRFQRGGVRSSSSELRREDSEREAKGRRGRRR